MIVFSANDPIININTQIQISRLDGHNPTPTKEEHNQNLQDNEIMKSTLRIYNKYQSKTQRERDVCKESRGTQTYMSLSPNDVCNELKSEVCEHV